MPYINITTTKKLDTTAMETIKADLGKAITLIPGKNEGGLMIAFNESETYHGGTKVDCAFISLKIFGTTTKEAFAAFGTEATKSISANAGVAPNHIYINFEEHKIWMSNGNMIG
jgi:hypothetical protein